MEVDGATQPGTLAYNSWLAMQAACETNADACQYNDFALAQIDPADVGRVDSSVPGFGGPTGVGPSSAMLGDTVYSCGNSSLRGELAKLSPEAGRRRPGRGQRLEPDGLTARSGVPDDSGSAFLSGSGQAIGTLSTLQILPVAGSNGVGDLAKEISYMHSNSSIGANLVPGTEAFTPDVVGAVLKAVTG